jgi:hypothetical protein
MEELAEILQGAQEDMEGGPGTCAARRQGCGAQERGRGGAPHLAAPAQRVAAAEAALASGEQVLRGFHGLMLVLPPGGLAGAGADTGEGAGGSGVVAGGMPVLLQLRELASAAAWEDATDALLALG